MLYSIIGLSLIALCARLGIKVRRLVTFLIFIHLMLAVVTSQECTDTVGSLSHDNNVVTAGPTFILADYTVPCSGTVVAWEFCYQILGVTSVTFYPGIWRITGKNGSDTDYALVQSNTVTYDQSLHDPQNPANNFPCQIFNLSDTDQFTAPASSVVGLYSGIQFTQLLRTNTDNSITAYQFSGNQSSIRAGSNDDVNYNIDIRAHLVPTSNTTTSSDTTTAASVASVSDTNTASIVSTNDAATVSPTTSIVSTSDTITTTVTTSTSIISTPDTSTASSTSDATSYPTTVTSTTSTAPTSDTTTVTPTTSIVSTSDATIIPTTSIVPTSDTTTVTPTTSIVSTSDNTTVTPTTSIVPTSDATIITTNTSIVSTSDPTIITTNTSIISTSDPTIITTNTSIVPTSDPTIITTNTSIVPTSDPTIITTNTSIVPTSDPTIITTNTSIVPTSDPTIITTNTSIVPTSDPTIITTNTSIISTSDRIATTAMRSPSYTNAIATTTSMVVTGNTNTTTDKRSDSDSGGGSSIGIIAGAVVGVILCIIVISAVVILLWHFSRRRKGKVNIPQVTQNLELVADKCGLSQESTAIDDSNYYSTVGSQPDIKHNGNVVYKNVVSEHEAPSYKNIKGSNDMSLHSKGSTGKSYSRFASNDYEAILNHAEYETAINFFSNSTRASAVYNNSLISEYSEVADAIDKEEIYSDPGHSKEDIYACFEKKKFRMIKRIDISILQKLGSGEFGVVNLGLWSNGSTDPVQVAVKTLNSQCSESDRVKFLREAAIMGQFKHSNVVQLHGVVFEEENAMIVLEYMPKGDLQEFLVSLKNNTPSETFNELKHDLLSYCRHVSAGLSHLASKGFVHRDLAARNILVSSDDVCKIADFGMARDVTDDTYYVSSGGKVPIKWTAPEALFYKKYSVQSDVWSFGCVMYEIWSLGHKPFEDLSGTEYINKITTGYRLPPPPGCPRAIYELMIKCWHPVANQRINSCLIYKALQKSDRALLPGAISAKDNEELSTGLGDPLTTSSNLYQDLQNTYLSTCN